MPKILEMPPISFLRARFQYCHESGRLIYRVGVSQRRRAGDEAGFIHRLGYRYVKLSFDGQKYQIAAHRIAWALFHNACPSTDMEIDHIDRDKLNNKISNLRLVTRRENANNRSIVQRSSAHPGVSRRKTGYWRAYAYRDGKYIHLGGFKTEQEAALAAKPYWR